MTFGSGKPSVGWHAAGVLNTKVFLIYDAPTGQVLFLGRVTDPSR